MRGIRFYRVVWHTTAGYHETIEAANNRRHISNLIKDGKIIRKFDGCDEIAQPFKIQEIETPVIEVEWLLNLFEKSGNKADREAHREQAAYILRLVEACAVRVLKEDGTLIER